MVKVDMNNLKCLRSSALNNCDLTLSEDFVPGPMDVICASGKKAYFHEGNQRYRNIIQKHLPQYSSAKSKLEKSFIVSIILSSIRDESPSCAGFIHNKNGKWEKVGDQAAREKIGQSFRDMLHDKYSSSRKAKTLRRKKRKQDKNNFRMMSSSASKKVDSVEEETYPFEAPNARSRPIQSKDHCNEGSSIFTMLPFHSIHDGPLPLHRSQALSSSLSYHPESVFTPNNSDSGTVQLGIDPIPIEHAEQLPPHSENPLSNNSYISQNKVQAMYTCEEWLNVMGPLLDEL